MTIRFSKYLLSTLIILFVSYSCQDTLKYKHETKQACHIDWRDIEQKEVLTILAENSPASYFLYKGRNMGYEYELLHEFAHNQ